MAMAILTANAASFTVYHPGLFVDAYSECLTWGDPANATVSWFSERNYYTEAMKDMGITTLTKENEDSIVAHIAEMFPDAVIGHYTNLMDTNMVGGIGISDVSGDDWKTTCADVVPTD